MKISKSTQKRVIALFVLVCLMLLPNLILSVLHVVIDEDWRTTDKITLVGTMDVRRPSYMLEESEQQLCAPNILREATEDTPAIVAEPSQYLIYVTEGDYVIDTPANSVRKVMLCISMVAVFVLTILLLGIVYQVIRGFRTGDFFTRKSVVMVRVMAVVYC
ncbi:MAG: hypothetical protein J6U49_04660, partial [Alistipes sp.]|nr:hypothetical protein [Alistipes sp.]